MSKIPSTLHTLTAGSQEYHYYSLPKAAETLGNIDRLPKTLKILLENQLRFADDESVEQADMQALVDWQNEGRSSREIGYRPARVLMQDFTGVPGVVDLASMRAAVESLGEDPARINPLSPVDLVIDHSVMVDKFGNPTAFQENVDIEMQRNGERYEFLRWGQKAFDNFSVVPPGTGICHQVNLEYLGRTVWTKQEDGKTFAYPDTLVGTDSHTTMINGLGVLGWGVGGIEAEAAMLGQPIPMLIPEVIGFKLTGKLPEGATATDLVLTVTQMLRKHGVVGKFVEFYGDGLQHLPLADRATIANMAPEYGATCGFFPVSQPTLAYLAAVVDVILLVGTNLRWEAPLVNTRIRKAIKKGAKVFAVGPEFDLTYKVEWLGNDASLLGKLPQDVIDAIRQDATDAVQSAAAAAKEVAPDITIHTSIVDGDAARVLLELGKDAALIVVGTRKLGSVKGLFLGSVSITVAAHHHGRVVVIDGELFWGQDRLDFVARKLGIV